MSLRRKKKSKHSTPVGSASENDEHLSDATTTAAPLSESLGRMKIGSSSPSSSMSRKSINSDHSSTPSLSRKGRKKKMEEIEMGIKNVEVLHDNTTIHTVEVLKRPGQTLGFYIREGNGKNQKKGVFISRIAEGSIVQKNGLLKVGDEIQEINSVNVTRTNLDDVVVLMSIPKKLILTIKTNRQISQSRIVGHEFTDAKPVYIHKQNSDETDSMQNFPRPLDLNTEDSNDSGLSSEHSLKGAETAQVSPYFEPVPAHHIPHQPTYATISQNRLIPPESTYISPKPRPPPRTDLCVSDSEHEYNPAPKLANRNGAARKEVFRKNQSFSHNDAYNSDSEFLPKCQANSQRHHLQQWGPVGQPRLIRANSSGSGDGSHSSLQPPGFSSEMQHWLRKFDHMSQEFKVEPSSANSEPMTTAQELDGYRNELWRQEKLLNDAIHNMESALNVDAMLQQSTHPSLPQGTNSLHRQTVQQSQKQGQTNQPSSSAYTYLRDLPLLIRTPMKVKIEDFKLYRPDYERIIPTDILSAGTMKVKLYCGHGLKSSRTSLRDLYCVFQLDHVKQAKTMIRTGAINFDWDETFDMKVEESTGSLVCMIYHWDPNIRHRLCFTGTIRLANIFNKAASGPQHHKCALRLEPRGILYLEISYCQDDLSQGVPNSLFGRPLQEVLCTESSDTNVPTIVTKCVSEVTSRGMRVVGIYRLCGAAKKKQQLRQEFERHPQLVDLSPSNVPEIHAITGLLKDYLRELPESLLTTHAYQVSERALTKDSTHDADIDSLEVVHEFVAKLHPWQQGIVIYILNHLKHVSLYQSENKMTTANLAVCFGPIFIPPQRSDGQEKESEASSMRLHIEIIKYLLDIWPQEFSTNNNIVI